MRKARAQQQHNRVSEEQAKHTQNDSQFKKNEIKDFTMEGAWGVPLPHICLLFAGFPHLLPPALKLYCIANFHMLFLVMGSICFADETKFVLI